MELLSPSEEDEPCSSGGDGSELVSVELRPTLTSLESLSDTDEMNQPLTAPLPKFRNPVPRKNPRQNYVLHKRKRGDTQTHRPGRRKALTRKNLHLKLAKHSETCHGQNVGRCLLSQITEETIITVWKENLGLSEPELAGRILTHLQNQCTSNLQSHRTRYSWEQKPVCFVAYCIIWGVSDKKMKAIRPLLWAQASPLAIVHENTSGFLEPVRTWVDGWSSGYLRENSDEYNHGNRMELHLQNFITYEEIAADMWVAWGRLVNPPRILPPSVAMLRSVVKDHFPYLHWYAPIPQGPFTHLPRHHTASYQASKRRLGEMSVILLVSPSTNASHCLGDICLWLKVRKLKIKTQDQRR